MEQYGVRDASRVRHEQGKQPTCYIISLDPTITSFVFGGFFFGGEGGLLFLAISGCALSWQGLGNRLWLWGSTPGLAVCKASTLIPVLPFWPHKYTHKNLSIQTLTVW